MPHTYISPFIGLSIETQPFWDANDVNCIFNIQNPSNIASLASRTPLKTDPVTHPKHHLISIWKATQKASPPQTPLSLTTFANENSSSCLSASFRNYYVDYIHDAKRMVPINPKSLQQYGPCQMLLTWQVKCRNSPKSRSAFSDQCMTCAVDITQSGVAQTKGPMIKPCWASTVDNPVCVCVLCSLSIKCLPL